MRTRFRRNAGSLSVIALMAWDSASAKHAARLSYNQWPVSDEAHNKLMLAQTLRSPSAARVNSGKVEKRPYCCRNWLRQLHKRLREFRSVLVAPFRPTLRKPLLLGKYRLIGSLLAMEHDTGSIERRC